ncbi:MAG: hypothetical protein Q9217_004477 [Psora testacea]
MAALAASIADTIAGMQKVLNNDQDSSDSDEPYLQPSNRGNKLKRRAQSISGGHDGRANGPKAYRKTIKHAGYSRDIIHRNPKRYDEDGDELATEDEDEEADTRAAEENPYAGIRLENLLMPLTSAAGLPDHPSMSVPYLSTTLSDMAQHACKMVQRERKTLCNAKKMLTKLRGDENWIPCGLVETVYDDEIFNANKVYETILSSAPNNGVNDRRITAENAVNEDSIRESNISKTELGNSHVLAVGGENEGPARTIPPDDLFPRVGEGVPGASHEDADGTQDKPAPNANGPFKGVVKPEETNNAEKVDETEEVDTIAETAAAPVQNSNMQNGNHEPSPQSSLDFKAEANALTTSGENGNADRRGEQDAEDIVEKAENEEEDANEGSRSPPRRITRAQAQAEKVTASTRSPSLDDWVPPQLHPLFLIPPTAKPDPDFGLPPAEAEETRRMLAAYVQKQEEVCRGAEKLYEGLLLADRQRKTVFKWSKAEAHVGEMSDGEDWYDKEEWGLEEDLRKGHMEDEEDIAVQGKKTRGRRA